jgi:hypothetical protein
MNRDDIIRMAREACDKDKVDPWHGGFWTITQEELERFFALAYAAGAAAKREECAKVCDDLQSEMVEQGIASPYGDRFADAIRARGEK